MDQELTHPYKVSKNKDMNITKEEALKKANDLLNKIKDTKAPAVILDTVDETKQTLWYLTLMTLVNATLVEHKNAEQLVVLTNMLGDLTYQCSSLSAFRDYKIRVIKI